MSSICALIAVLSFICVLNIVFRERENTGRLLHNIGFSKSKSTIMYATEAVMLFIAQTVFGIALGILLYSVSYSVRTGIMGMSGYSAFTTSYVAINLFTGKAKEKKIAPLFRFGGRDAFTFARQ